MILKGEKIVPFLTLLTIVSFLLIGKAFGQDATPTATLTPSSTPLPTPTSSQVDTTNQEKASELQKQIKEYEQKVSELQGQAKTLFSQIKIMDSQIKLTELRIEEIKRKVEQLQKDIDITRKKVVALERKIDFTTKALLSRIIAVYQAGRLDSWQIFLTSDSISNLFTRIKYLKIVQIYDKKNIYAAEQSKLDYSNQKAVLEERHEEEKRLEQKLEGYTKQLVSEKAGKEELLKITRNDESKYQRLLAQARAERAIVLGGGTEVFSRNVNAGDNVGTIITGVSGCSTGTHLHLSVYQGTSVRDPNDYLSSKSFSYSYDSPLYGYYGIINPHGSYPWPLDDPIIINQGYGSHEYSARYPDGIHDGIDMEGGSLNVKAVRSGKLYEGSYSGCSYGPLSYAKVEHDDGLITWYLHIIPN